MSRLDKITGKAKARNTLEINEQGKTYFMFARLIKTESSGYNTCRAIGARGASNKQNRLYLINQMLERFPCLDSAV